MYTAIYRVEYDGVSLFSELISKQPNAALDVGTVTLSGHNFQFTVFNGIGSTQIVNVEMSFTGALVHGGLGTNTALVSGPIPRLLTATLTTTEATSDTVPVIGMKATGHCYLTPTNAGAAGGITSVFVSAKATNQITVSHAAEPGWTFDVACSPQ
jgi:hypothetical protein